MAFVPEGGNPGLSPPAPLEAKISRCDLLQMSKLPLGTKCQLRPGGTVEVIVSPRDICPRNRVDAALETPGIPVERYVGV
jgi:hypothetical protein